MSNTKILQAIEECQKRNNSKAFKVLYNHFSSQLYYTCLRYLKNENDAQDALQETFITAYDKIKSYNGSGHFGGWISRIAVNKCLQKLKKDKKNILVKQIHDEVDRIDLLDEDIMVDITDNKEKEIMNSLNNLPIGYKTILNLFVIEGYSHKEIGELLNIKESTSRSQLNRAKIAFKKEFQIKIQ